MPRLRTFTPCQQAIVNVEDKTASLIGLLNGVQVRNNEADPVPFDAVVPFKWYIFTLWHRTAEDEGKTFEQRIQLRQPDGEEFFSFAQTFRISSRIHMVISRAENFPVGQVGECVLALSLREEGTEQNWVMVDEHPILVEYIDQEQESED